MVHACCSMDCAVGAITASTAPTTTKPSLLRASGSSSSHASPAKPATNVISTKIAPHNDDGEHDTSLTVAPLLNPEHGVPVMLSTSSTTEVGVILPAASVCIPWASTRPWLEPVPPQPPDSCSLFAGVKSHSRPVASITQDNAIFEVFLGPGRHSSEIPMQNIVLGSVLRIYLSSSASSLLATDSMESGIVNQDGIPGAYDCHVYKLTQKYMARVFPMIFFGADFQLKIAWFSTCYATVMKLQNLSYECTAYIGVPLIRTTVCYTMLFANGNKFRNLACSQSSVVPYEPDYFRWSVASSAASPSHWFVPIFGVQNLNEPQVLGYTSMVVYGFSHPVHYYPCFSLVTGACKRAMEYGIMWQSSFVNEKSQVAFSAFSDGPVNPYAQWLQTLVQLNYQDQDIDLKNVCNLCVKIFKQIWYAGSSSGSCLLVGVSESIFQLWYIPWFSFIFIDLTSEERYGLALFQLEIDWQLGTTDSERKCYYQYHVFKGKETSKFHPVAAHELQGSTYNLFSGGTDQTHKVRIYMKISYSDHCQMGMYFKVGHLFYHVVQYTTQGDFGCGDVALYSSFPTCTDMRMEQSKGSGELIQWLTSNPCGSDISTIKSIDMNALLSWVFMDRDGATIQHWKIYWDPGSAFRIWLVALTEDCLKFVGDRGQAPFQGGRNVIRAFFTNQVHVSQDKYINCINQIIIDSAYYLEQAYYLDKV